LAAETWSTMTYEFLSPEWILEARVIRDEFASDDAPAIVLAMNLTITEVPFGDSPLKAHLDTTVGVLALDYGHHPSADISITVDWATAKALLIDGNPQAAMSAFMAGKVRVEGDMAKLVALQNSPGDARSEAVIERLRAITA
jgi:hypothetical protein